MTLLHFDGFEWLHSSATTNNTLAAGMGYSAIGTNIGRDAGRFGGQALSSSTSSTLTHSFAANETQIIIGFAFYQGSTGTATIFELQDGSTTQIGLARNGSGQLYVFRNTTATVLATGASLAISAWYWLEAKFTIGDSGSWEIKINGSVYLSGTGDTQQTANAYATALRLTGNANCWIDDLYLCDPDGAAPYNDYLGECRVQTVLPTGAGSSTQFTPSTGSNWQNVDDSPNDADSTYNATATSGHIDLFATGDLTGTPTIYAASIFVAARKDDTAARSMRTKLKSGATTVDGTSLSLTTSYATVHDDHLTDPDTGASWTVSGINALEIGYENI